MASTVVATPSKEDTSAASDSAAATAAAVVAAANKNYTFDAEKLEELRKTSPWRNDPKWFKNVTVSPTAIVKMMTHCQSGVEKGLKKGGKPTEVMGLMLGRPDPTSTSSSHTLIITDVFPLPIEGFETRVIADDQDVVNYMIELGESLESTRKEKFMGWYHSHPFDLGVHSHCFMSQTDISTQLQWQRAEDPHGNPFLAIVVDPLRSIAKNVPEIKAFRVYPPEYNSPITNECPDGSIVANEKMRLERWGSCWDRYYELNLDYFMSHSARNVMEILTQSLWMGNLSTTASLEGNNQQRYPGRVTDVADNLKRLDVASIIEKAQGAASGIGGVSKPGGVGSKGGDSSGQKEGSGSGRDGGGDNAKSEDSELKKACDGVVELATEKIQETMVQAAKKDLFL